jgi:hypothetical protein
MGPNQNNIIKGEYQDSFTIGTSATGGAIKVYGDINSPTEFAEKIENAINLFNKYKQEKKK